jgi:ribosomal protein S15P/S13E
MARRGSNKKGSNYTNGTRIKNRLRKLSKHLRNNPDDKDAQRALNNTTK